MDWRALCIIGFASEVPKMGFWGDFGASARGKDIWWESTSVLRIVRFQRSFNFGPDLIRRIVAFCMGIAICHIRKLGQVCVSPEPLPEVAEKLRCRKTPLWIFDYHTKKSE